MGLVAGLAAVGQGLVLIFPGEGGPFVTSETAFIPFRLEQSRIGAIVGFVAQGTFAFPHRTMRIFQIRLCLPHFLVTAETEGRNGTVEISASDQTVAPVTGLASFLLDRAMHDPLAVPLPVVAMALQARLAAPPLAARTPPGASRQQEHRHRP